MKTFALLFIAAVLAMGCQPPTPRKYTVVQYNNNGNVIETWGGVTRVLCYEHISFVHNGKQVIIFGQVKVFEEESSNESKGE
jgi:hypothetical protein